MQISEEKEETEEIQKTGEAVSWKMCQHSGASCIVSEAMEGCYDGWLIKWVQGHRKSNPLIGGNYMEVDSSSIVGW